MLNLQEKLELILSNDDMGIITEAADSIHEQNKWLEDMDESVGELQSCMDNILQNLEDYGFTDNDFENDFESIQAYQILSYCESKINDCNNELCDEAKSVSSHLFDCVISNPAVFVGNLVENLTKLTGKTWILDNQDDYYEYQHDYVISCSEDKNKKFFVRDGESWFAGAKKRDSVKDTYLTVPVKDMSLLDAYCDFAEVLELGLFNFDRESIKNNLSKPNSLYTQIPELEKAVSKSMFDKKALTELKEREEQLYF